MRKRVYLDWNASAPLRPEAREAMLAALDVTGNPSSVHSEGRAARAIVEKAREQVAEATGCKPAEVIFNSGATEAASVLARTPEGHDVLVDETAHDALWAHARMSHWTERPNGPGHTLAMGLANSETGIITEPPAQVDGQWPFGRARADWLLLDVTQAAGRIPFSFAWSGADFAVLSAHKQGGPRGVGALIARDGLDIAPLALGGGQELSRRAGTENVAGIAGFGAAAQAAARDLADGVWDQVAEIRNILEEALEALCDGIILTAKGQPRLPNTVHLIAPGWKGETQVMAMDLAGFAVSSGSACSSGKVKSSRVLAAMGFDSDQAASALRVSFGPETGHEDVLRFAEAYARGWSRVKERRQQVGADLPNTRTG